MPPKKKAVKKAPKRTTKQAPKKTQNVIVNVNSNNKRGNTTTNKKTPAKSQAMPSVVYPSVQIGAPQVLPPSVQPAQINAQVDYDAIKKNVQDAIKEHIDSVIAEEQKQSAQQLFDMQDIGTSELNRRMQPTPAKPKFEATQGSVGTSELNRRMQPTPLKIKSESSSTKGSRRTLSPEEIAIKQENITAALASKVPLPGSSVSSSAPSVASTTSSTRVERWKPTTSLTGENLTKQQSDNRKIEESLKRRGLWLDWYTKDRKAAKKALDKAIGKEPMKK